MHFLNGSWFGLPFESFACCAIPFTAIRGIPENFTPNKLSRDGFEGSEGSENTRNRWSGKESLPLSPIGNPSETVLQVNFIKIDEKPDFKRNKSSVSAYFSLNLRSLRILRETLQKIMEWGNCLVKDTTGAKEGKPLTIQKM